MLTAWDSLLTPLPPVLPLSFSLFLAKAPLSAPAVVHLAALSPKSWVYHINQLVCIVHTDKPGYFNITKELTRLVIDLFLWDIVFINHYYSLSLLPFFTALAFAPPSIKICVFCFCIIIIFYFPPESSSSLWLEMMFLMKNFDNEPKHLKL